MWRNLPFKLLGMFAEAFGQPVCVANAFIRSTIAEYDGCSSKNTMHRVARQALDPASKIRKLLDRKVSDDLPMDALPELWQFVSSYSFMLLCGTRNEGDHRTIKLESRHAVGSVTPPYLCSRLRLKDILANCECQQFATFVRNACSSRGRKSLFCQLLQGEFSYQRLLGMSWSRKCSHVYQYDLQELFKDTGEATSEIT